tara:strand:+ start:1123 stop:1290 length:168 start_codon:yes stop_codon:yes gene_type:complete
MKNKSIFTEEELMQFNKEFLIATILKLEEQNIYWQDKYHYLLDDYQEFLKKINDK